jgi:VRR-NUC domain
VLAPEPETEFQAKVLELARIYRWRAFHTYDSRRSTPGFPDLVLIRPPRLIFAELKSARGALTVDQKEWLTDLAFCMVEAYVWHVGDIQHVTEVLAR